MAMHKTNGLLKFVAIPVVIILILILLLSSRDKNPSTEQIITDTPKNTASHDSAAESLDTLTAQLSTTEQTIKSVMADNQTLKQQHRELTQQVETQKQQTTTELSQEIAQLKSQLQALSKPIPKEAVSEAEVTPAQPITTVPELSILLTDPKNKEDVFAKSVIKDKKEKPTPVPYYTIPANATSIKDRLMTALVGRIPVKGVVTDPYPFKIVFSDNTLAANGLRVPNLRQMIVSGYTEGDLNLLSTRGWVTSLTFVFADGTISTTTSNDNNIGRFTKENALGYLSDELGNPFIRGMLITNAPAYLATNVALGAAQGAANAYAESQTTTQTHTTGNTTSSVTGSQGAYVAGQATTNAAAQVQQWWLDRQAQSFDAIYVPTLKANQTPQWIAVNFAKEISIDYDPQGRKLVYAYPSKTHVTTTLD